MFMFNNQSFYKRMCKGIKDDEQFCLICNKKMSEEKNVNKIWKDSLICSNCENQMKKLNRIYKLDIDWIVLYEYNDFLERLLFRYKEQRDVVLAPLFLEEYKSKLLELSKKYAICTMCSSDEKRLERGFEPINRMLEVNGIEVYSPLYKTENIKQSSQRKGNRDIISNYIKKKEYYSLPDKPVLLVDDVVTTGNTLKTGIELLNAKKVLAFCANPLWIQENLVAKQKRF